LRQFENGLLLNVETPLFKDFSRLIETFESRNLPFWIVGKGPSLGCFQDVDAEPSRTISINHAIQQVDAGLALFVDIEALLDCHAALLERPRIVLVPYWPHIEGIPTSEDIESLGSNNRVVREILERNSVFAFDTSNAKKAGTGPRIEIRYFSSEPAYQIASILGASEVRLFGIDGGSSYSQHLDASVQLNNLRFGQESFDLQWGQLDALSARHGIPIVKSPQIGRVFVGVTEREEVPFRVLKHSIEKNSRTPVDVSPIPPARRIAISSVQTGTLFSLQRFEIPNLMRNGGRAVYLDSDMLVFGDISELLGHDLGGHSVAVVDDPNSSPHWEFSSAVTKGIQLSVMVLDCERLQWNVDDIVDDLTNSKYSYRELMTTLCITPAEEIDTSISSDWNSLDRFETGKTKLIHFTNVPMQPWTNPLSEYFDLWAKAMLDALRANYLSVQVLDRAVRKGHVHPELWSLARRAGCCDRFSRNRSWIRRARFASKNYTYRVLSMGRNLIFRGVSRVRGLHD
jgi:hypothetical protein